MVRDTSLVFAQTVQVAIGGLEHGLHTAQGEHLTLSIPDCYI